MLLKINEDTLVPDTRVIGPTGTEGYVSKVDYNGCVIQWGDIATAVYTFDELSGWLLFEVCNQRILVARYRREAVTDMSCGHSSQYLMDDGQCALCEVARLRRKLDDLKSIMRA